MERQFDQRTEWGLLLLRVVAGIAFVMHGMSKFQMGLDQVAIGLAAWVFPAFSLMSSRFLSSWAELA